MKIGTHDGTFHADDVFALATLYELGMVEEVVRTRDAAVLAACDLRVDVGGVYDHEGLSYDHHQKEGAGDRPNGVAYAAFGLIWQHYGEQLAGSAAAAAQVDQTFVQPLDAEDVGDKAYRLVHKALALYSVGTLIGRFNPEWDDPAGDSDAAFARAVLFAREVLRREIVHARAVVAAAEQVRAAIGRAEDARVIILDGRYPWQETVVREASKALFVVYPSEVDWRVHVVPREVGSYVARQDLPAIWGGKPPAELAAITGVKDVVFCHRALFLAGALSRAGALRLAELALG